MGITLDNSVFNFIKSVRAFPFNLFAAKMIFISIIFFFLIPQASVIGADDWVLKKEKDGIRVYMRSVAGTEIKEIRANFFLKSSLNSVMALLKDVPAYKEWIYRCKEVALLNQPNQNEIYYYQQTLAPWPVTNRDLIVHSHWKQDEASKIIYINGKCMPDYIPEKDGVVRIRNFSNSWKLTPMQNGMVEIDYQISVDPAGLIPVWLVNLTVAEGPYQTCLNLIKTINNPKYKASTGIVEEP